MSKICNNCGSALEEDVVFCTNCGAQTAAPAETPAEKPAPKKNLKPLIIAASAVLAIVVVVIIIASLLGGGGYKSAVTNYQSLLNGKAKVIEKMAPKAYWEYLEEEEDIELDDVIDDFEDSYEDMLEYWEDEYGKNVKVTIKIEDAEKMDSDDVKDIAKALKESYDIDKSSVKEAYEVELEMTIKGKDDDDDDSMDAVCVKIGSGWYLISTYEYDDTVYARFLVDSFT